MYCDLSENSLTEFKDCWNSHSIRASRLAGCPAGVPDDLYDLPQLHGMTMCNITAIVWAEFFALESSLYTCSCWQLLYFIP